MYAVDRAAETGLNKNVVLNWRTCPHRLNSADALQRGLEGLHQGQSSDAAYAAFCDSLQDRNSISLEQLCTTALPQSAQHASRLAAHQADDQHHFSLRPAQHSMHTSCQSTQRSHSIYSHHDHPFYPSHITNSDHTHLGHSDLSTCDTTPVPALSGHPAVCAQATNLVHTHFGHSSHSPREPSPIHTFTSESHSPLLPSFLPVDVSPANGVVAFLHQLEGLERQQNVSQLGDPDQMVSDQRQDLQDDSTPTSSFQTPTPNPPRHKLDVGPLAQAELSQPNPVAPGPTGGCKQGSNETKRDQHAPCVDPSLARRRLAKRDSARRMRARRREQLNSLDFELQELLATKFCLEDSLKEVDKSIPSLRHQLDATLASTQETRHNNEALQQEIAELQRMADGLNARLHDLMEHRLAYSPSVCGI